MWPLAPICRALFIYAFTFFVLRIAPRRVLAEASPFDFVLLLILSETTQQAMVGDDNSVATAAILIATLVGTDVLVSKLKMRSSLLRLLLEGEPEKIFEKGKIYHRAMRKHHVTEDDIVSEAREKWGLSSLDEVDEAVVESSGEISIKPKRTTAPRVPGVRPMPPEGPQ